MHSCYRHIKLTLAAKRDLQKVYLDAADAAYALETYDQEDACITFNCVKMRSAAQRSFTSTMNWETQKIGPDSALSPQEREDSSLKTGEEIDDVA